MMENLLNRLQIVQECDAGKDNSSTTDAPLNKSTIQIYKNKKPPASGKLSFSQRQIY